MSDQRCSLLITQQDAFTIRPPIKTPHPLDDPDYGEDGKHQCGPVNESRPGLMHKDGPEIPSDGNGRRGIALGSGECISRCCPFQEEERQEDKDLSPHSGMMGPRIWTKCLEGREDDKDSRPPVVQREWKVDKDLVRQTLSMVIFLDDIINMRHSRANKQGHDECEDIIVPSPELDVDSVQDTEQREAPRHAVDDDSLSMREELVDDGAEEK